MLVVLGQPLPVVVRSMPQDIRQTIQAVLFFLHRLDRVLGRRPTGVGTVGANELCQQRLTCAATGAGTRALAENRHAALSVADRLSDASLRNPVAAANLCFVG